MRGSIGTGVKERTSPEDRNSLRSRVRQLVKVFANAPEPVSLVQVKQNFRTLVKSTIWTPARKGERDKYPKGEPQNSPVNDRGSMRKGQSTACTCPLCTFLFEVQGQQPPGFFEIILVVDSNWLKRNEKQQAEKDSPGKEQQEVLRHR